MIEVKSPNTATHIKTILGASIDSGYMLQMMMQLDSAQRSWVDFVSYDPRLTDNLMIHITRVDRDEDMIREIRREVVSFLGDADKLEAKLRAYTEEEPASSEPIETGGNENLIEKGIKEHVFPKPSTPALKEGELF